MACYRAGELVLFQHFSPSAAFELEWGKFRAGSGTRSGVTLIWEQGAARAAGCCGWVQNRAPTRAGLPQKGSQDKAVETAAASKLGHNTRHSSMERACTGCGLVTDSRGQAYTVSSGDKEENCMEGTLGALPSPLGHPRITPSSKLTINPTDLQQEGQLFPSEIGKTSRGRLQLRPQQAREHQNSHPTLLTLIGEYSSIYKAAILPAFPKSSFGHQRIVLTSVVLEQLVTQQFLAFSPPHSLLIPQSSLCRAISVLSSYFSPLASPHCICRAALSTCEDSAQQ